MGKNKKTTKIKVTAKPKKKPVKPKFNDGSNGGFLTAKIVATVNKGKEKK